jgi:hypothetical protein
MIERLSVYITDSNTNLSRNVQKLTEILVYIQKIKINKNFPTSPAKTIQDPE